MLLRLCQLKSLLPKVAVLLTFTSCGLFQERDVSGTNLLQTYGRDWFKVNPEHSLLQHDGEVSSHLFFDTPPELKEAKRTVNVIITTPAGSDHSYQLDLNSGQRYYSHTYCKQPDVWQNYKGSIHRPGFSIGYIPRVMDQLGQPQKIIVWSDRKDFAQNLTTHYQKVRIMGAYVEQLCPEGNCLGKGNWLSRLVFVGVDAEDKGFEKITDLTEFQKKINWEKSKAELENLEGHNFLGDQAHPRFRVSKLISYEDGFDYFKKRSLFLKDQELKKIQRSCHSLYDRLWDDVGKWRPEDVPAKNAKELNEKLKLREKLKENRKPVGFAARLHKFTEKYANEMATCEKFVYHGNINRHPEKFWFLSYMGLFYRLNREGYYFDCRIKNWQKNTTNDEGEPIFDLKTGILYCNEADIDLAMGYLPNFLKGLSGESTYYRFIDYDNRSHGTHRKLYSWIQVKGIRTNCEKDPNERIRKETRIFPEDVKWQERRVKDIADKMKIIY